MRENKVLAPKQNLNNNREKGIKITVPKLCQLVDLEKVLTETNWPDFCINELRMWLENSEDKLEKAIRAKQQKLQQ